MRKRYSAASSYTPGSAYAVLCPMPESEPAVASDKCSANPESGRPAFRMRVKSTSRFVRKSVELYTFCISIVSTKEATEGRREGGRKEGERKGGRERMEEDTHWYASPSMYSARRISG